jgi:hypothetical protein
MNCGLFTGIEMTARRANGNAGDADYRVIAPLMGS